jgi:hypothetical protein
MGLDFTSYFYPYTKKVEEVTGENDDEPAGENVRSSVENEKHPLFSPEGLKETLNLNRLLSNSGEELITGDIDEKLIESVMDVSLKKKIPFETIIYAMDFEKKLDERGPGEGDQFAQKVLDMANELPGILGRQPKNLEMFIGLAAGSASAVKKVIDSAKSNPNDPAEAVGTSQDKLVTQKKKGDKEVPRTNKEVLQFFGKRMGIGNNVFPHTVEKNKKDA